MESFDYVINLRFPALRAYAYHVAEMLRALRRAGVNVRFISDTRVEQALPPADWHYFEQALSGVPHVRLPIIDLYRLPLGRFIPDYLTQRVAGLTWIISWFIFLFFGSRQSVIYTRSFAAALIAVWHGRSVIFEDHVLGRLGRRKARLVRQLRLLVVISDGLKSDYVALGAAVEKIIVAPDAFAPETMPEMTQGEARGQLGWGAGVYIVYTGHLYPWKGAHVLARAAAHLPDARFVFVGGAPEDVPLFQEFLRGEGIKNVTLLGHVPHEEVNTYLRAASVLVLPSSAKEKISRVYTSPLKLFEYMNAGRPIVASDIPSIREILRPENAILVAPDDPAALAEGITRALVADVGAPLAAQAKIDAQVHTWDNRVQQILKKLRG